MPKRTKREENDDKTKTQEKKSFKRTRGMGCMIQQIYLQYVSNWKFEDLQREREDIQIWSHYVQMISQR